jgi:hypothetical protein
MKVEPTRKVKEDLLINLKNERPNLSADPSTSEYQRIA